MRSLLAFILAAIASFALAQGIPGGGGGGGGGGGTPGGTNGQLQYNNSGAFGGFTVGGDASLNTGTGALTISKIGGVNVGSLATQNAVTFTQQPTATQAAVNSYLHNSAGGL